METYYLGGAQEKFLRGIGFSDAVAASGRLLYIGGQVGQTPDGELREGLREQALQAFENIKTVVEMAGGKMEHVVHVMIFLSESSIGRRREWWEIITEALKTYMPNHQPSGTGVWIRELASPKLLVEIQAVAVVP